MNSIEEQIDYYFLHTDIRKLNMNFTKTAIQPLRSSGDEDEPENLKTEAPTPLKKQDSDLLKQATNK
jgi:hypothetical protein